MKSSIVKLSLSLMLASGTLQAFADRGPEDGMILREHIIELLQAPDLRNTNIDAVTGTLHIQVNAKSEIVVVQVDTDSEFVDQYVKTKLNYHKLTDEVATGRYVVKLTVKDGSKKS